MDFVSMSLLTFEKCRSWWWLSEYLLWICYPKYPIWLIFSWKDERIFEYWSKIMLTSFFSVKLNYQKFSCKFRISSVHNFFIPYQSILNDVLLIMVSILFLFTMSFYFILYGEYNAEVHISLKLLFESHSCHESPKMSLFVNKYGNLFAK